jgi:hypothetical protein
MEWALIRIPMPCRTRPYICLTPALNHIALTRRAVSNCGIITRVVQEVVARRRSSTLVKYMSAILFVRRQMVLC